MTDTTNPNVRPGTIMINHTMYYFVEKFVHLTPIFKGDSVALLANAGLNTVAAKDKLAERLDPALTYAVFRTSQAGVTEKDWVAMTKPGSAPIANGNFFRTKYDMSPIFEDNSNIILEENLLSDRKPNYFIVPEYKDVGLPTGDAYFVINANVIQAYFDRYLDYTSNHAS